MPSSTYCPWLEVRPIIVGTDTPAFISQFAKSSYPFRDPSSSRLNLATIDNLADPFALEALKPFLGAYARHRATLRATANASFGGRALPT